jgi:flagellar protein FliO/FliZ
MTVSYLLNVLLMLALVGGMAVGTLWLMRKFQPGLSIGGQRDRLVKVVDAVPMGATGGRLAVVEFEGKRILVGISRGRMDVLCEAPIDGAFSRYIDDGGV